MVTGRHPPTRSYLGQRVQLCWHCYRCYQAGLVQMWVAVAGAWMASATLPGADPARRREAQAGALLPVPAASLPTLVGFEMHELKLKNAAWMQQVVLSAAAHWGAAEAKLHPLVAVVVVGLEPLMAQRYVLRKQICLEFYQVEALVVCSEVQVGVVSKTCFPGPLQCSLG